MKYDQELAEFKTYVDKYGIKKFIESSFDQYTVNWFIKTFEGAFPQIKRILIEKKEEDIFSTIMANQGKVNINDIENGSCC